MFGGVDAELRDPLGVRRHGDEVLGDGGVVAELGERPSRAPSARWSASPAW